ncbi:hypothetical protein ASF41_04595 [Methylobacterium sp. Leaf111]|uniref:hypothetical protein n=1 Tax=Methylobacterium sp. Leaf111 TaxID=1736257 RepID=UPI0006F1E705|nr:hypothetical protein [Methylobacterium sp. Leaf111]KQO68603.1 hypothetical protein ASF18_03225 [Methylobacterium sp. Leaf89]KQP72518.1 hypothetical protein ASF41_04595 [Methylobacterium sp. Leaf111]
MCGRAPHGVASPDTLVEGRTVEPRTNAPPGTKEKPTRTAQVTAQVRAPIVPVSGTEKLEDRIGRLNTLETLAGIRTRSPVPMARDGLAAGVPMP